MALNLTNLTQASSISDIARYSNSISNGILFNGFIIVLFLILVLAFYSKTNFARAITASAWIMAFIATIFNGIGLVNLNVVFILIILGMIGAFVIATGLDKDF